jgi:hypothetical protein
VECASHVWLYARDGVEVRPAGWAGKDPGMPTPFPRPDEGRGLEPALRAYLLDCVRAAQPSALRAEALRVLEAAGEPLRPAPHSIDWDGIEAEAVRRGCTVADVLYERTGRHYPDITL